MRLSRTSNVLRRHIGIHAWERVPHVISLDLHVTVEAKSTRLQLLQHVPTSSSFEWHVHDELVLNIDGAPVAFFRVQRCDIRTVSRTSGAIFLEVQVDCTEDSNIDLIDGPTMEQVKAAVAELAQIVRDLQKESYA